MCPSCGKQNVFVCDPSVTPAVCHYCTWQGHMDELVRHEFKVERVAHVKIDYDVIDRIVYLFYGHDNGESDFCMVWNGEWGNDSSHQFDVEPVIDKYEAKDAAKFRKDGKPRNLSNEAVMNILCQDGWLEPGKYLVEVCW
jgi:hypothetical protein